MLSPMASPASLFCGGISRNARRVNMCGTARVRRVFSLPSGNVDGMARISRVRYTVVDGSCASIF